MCTPFVHFKVFHTPAISLMYNVAVVDGEVSSPVLSNQDVKETLSDLSEALECATSGPGEEGMEKCQQKKEQFREKQKRKLTTVSEPPTEDLEEEEMEDDIDDDDGGDEEDDELEVKKISDDDELSMFDHVEITSQFPRPISKISKSATSTTDPTKQPLDADELLEAMNNPPPREYPQNYHTLEFLPYNPVPERLDTAIFPHKESPLPLYDDPYWPTKRDCLSLLAEIRAKPNYVTFTGTFITPEARGAE